MADSAMRTNLNLGTYSWGNGEVCHGGPNRKALEMRLSDLVRQLAAERAITRHTEDQYRRAAESFGRHLGRRASVNDLSHSAVNEWLEAIAAEYKPISLRGKKVGLLAIWNYAAELRLCRPYSPRRIRKVRVDVRPPKAWTEDQVGQLLEAASGLSGSLRCGLPAAGVMTAWTRINYEAGLRQNDILGLRFGDIDQRGVLSITQSKTGRPHVTRVSPATVSAVEAIRAPNRDRIFPLSKNGIRIWKDRLLAAAKIGRLPRQGLNTLRKSHASAVARQRGLSEAAASLGHVGDLSTARDWYIEPAAPAVWIECPQKKPGG